MFDRTTPITGKSPQSLILSTAIHGALVIGLIFVRFATPPAVAPPLKPGILLIAPALAPHKTVESRPETLKLPSGAPFRLPAHVAPSTPAIAIEVPALQLIGATIPAPVIQVATPLPPQIHVGGFSEVAANSAPAPKKTEVSAAGFGDVWATQGEQARRTIPAGAGFGDANIAAVTTVSGKTVRASGFGDVSATPASSPRRVEITPVTAAQILMKPRPAYTAEARRLQIEGEVQLEILFRASGQIDILRIIQGLGHGLDESAAQAARTIRFTPARRDGQPIDSTATVHIIFQLAS